VASGIAPTQYSFECDGYGQNVSEAAREPIGALSVSTLPPNSPRPIFKPRQTKVHDVTWWHVEAEWADGTIDEIGQFKSISEAWGWIAHQSRAWAEDRMQASPRQ
jgi:hypothetical protein